MKKKLALTFIVSLCLFFPLILQANEIESLRSDVEELKLGIQVLEAEAVEANHKIEGSMKVTGYADGEYIVTDKKGSVNGFRVHHLSLFFQKEISDKWRLFSEIEYEDAPKFEGTTAEGKIFVEVFTIEHLINPHLNFRLGRYLTPGGIWNVEHYPPFVTTQERPKHIRKIFPQLNDGLQLYGSTNLDNVVADYILYVGNGSGNTGHGDGNSNKSLGGRAKFKLPLFNRTEVGFSYFTENDNNFQKVSAIGTDLKLNWKKFKFQAEYATGAYEPTGGGDFDRTGYYGQLVYGMGNLDLVYRYDYYDESNKATGDKTTVNTAAINYHFNPSVVGKAEYHAIDPESSTSYYKAIFSVAVYLPE